MKSLWLRFLIFAIIVFLGCQGKETPQKVDLSKRVKMPRRNGIVDETPVFRIAIGAMISPKETIDYYGQLSEYIGKKMGSRVEIIQRKTYAEINELVRTEKVDAAFVCSGPYVEGREEFGMEAVAVPVVDGRPYYHAYFIVRKGSGIKSIEDLRGRSFAFTDPKSNTGALVPIYILSRMGERPSGYFSKVIYTYSHDNSILAVAKGLVDGASVDSLIYDYYRRYKPELVEKTKVIFKSEPYGIPPVVVSPQAPAVLKMKLQAVLTRMHEDPEGKKILKALNIDRFEVPDEGLYESVKKMVLWLKGKR